MPRTQFHQPMPRPIEWADVQQPDPEDHEDNWLIALVVIVVALIILWGLDKIGYLA